MQKKALFFIALLSGLGSLLYGPKTLGNPSVPPPGQDQLVFATTILPNGQYGSSYTPLTITVTGGSSPYTFAVTSGILPPGMSLSADGTFSGIPTAAGSYPITVTATDATPDPNQVTGSQGYTLVIDKVPLMITPVSVSKAYGAALPAFTANYSGFVLSDGPGSLTTAPTLSTTATAASPVSTYTITAGGAVDANYAISYGTGNLTITAVPLTITPVSVSKAYGAALPTFTADYSGFVNGDGAGNLTTAPTISTTATAASGVGNYTITAANAVDANYTISYSPGTLTITAVPLTITPVSVSKAYGANLPAFTANYTGFVNGDGAASLTTAPAFSTTANATSSVGTYPITAANAVDANYTISYGTGTLTITPASLTITPVSVSKVYGAALPTFTVNYSGFVNGDVPASLSTAPTISTTATAASPVGAYTITAAGAADANYNISYSPGTLTVTAVPLTIKANDATKIYGAALPALSVQYSGFVNGDGPGNLTNPAAITTTATAASPVNTYPINVAGATDPNYTITFTPGVLTVTKATLTVTANNQTMPLGGPLPALTVAYSGFVNSDGPSSLTTQPTATTTATAASPAGSYTITPANGVSSNYNFTYATGTLSVGKAILTITANPASSVYGSPLASPLTVSYSGFVNGDNASSLTTLPTVTNAASAGSPVGTYTLTPTGAQSDNYTFTYVNGTYTISPATLTIAAVSQNMTYGGPVPTLTASYTGFVNGDNAASLTTPVTITTTASSSSAVGSYPISVSGAVDHNYTIAYTAGTISVNKATLTVTANDQSMGLGGPLPALTISYSGFVNGDNASKLNTQPTATTTATATSPAGTYPITPANGVSSNYTFTYVAGTLTVGRAVLTITANPAGSVYGSPLSGALTVSYSGFVNGDNASSLTTPPTVTNAAFAGAPAGSYALTPSGAQSSNYNIHYVNGAYTISPASLTVTVASQIMTYGGAVPTLTVSYSGFVNGDNPASLTTPPAVVTSASSASPAGIYSITASGAVDPNYIISYVPGTMTIGKAALTVTADSKSMPLGGPVPTLTISYSGFVNGDGPGNLTTQPSISTTANAASPAGAYPITVSGAASPNYTFNYVTGILAVGKALLTITANPAGSVYGAPIAAGSSLTVTYSGFVNGDGPGNLTQQPTVTNTAFTGAPVGSYALIPSGAQSNNYAINYVNGAYTISPASLNITAVSQTMNYGGTVPPLTVTYSGFVNGDNATRLSTQPTLTTTASVSSPVGTYPISASGAVDANYTISYTAGTMTVQPATLTVTPNPISITYGGAVPTLTASYSGFVNGDNASRLTTQPTLTTTATSSSPAGSYPITASGAASANYSFVYNSGTFTINPAALQITALPKTKTYGTPDPTFTYTVSGLVNGENSSVFTGSLSRAPGENVGTYPITIGSLSAGGNYTLNFTGSNFTITIGSQRINWTQSLIVGCSDQTQVQLTATASSGLPISYSVSDPTVASVSGNTLSLLKPGTAIVIASQAGDANYNPATSVADTIYYQAASLIRQRWSDAIFFDNSSDDYVSWQWYKNGDAVPGATSPYYSESPSLSGQYFVIATNKDSQRVQSCTLSITPGTAIAGGIKVFPNPAAAGAAITVNSNYTSAALQGAVLSVIDLSGRVRQQITSVQPSMSVTMPSETGTYIINLVLVSGQKASVNVLVVQ